MTTMTGDRFVALFDLDGTLLDTPRAIAQQLIVAVAEITGRQASFEAAHALIGRPLPEICATLSELNEDSAKVLDIVGRYRDLYREKVVPAALNLLFPGVVAGLNELTKAGIEMAVVTSKQSDSANLILNEAGIGHYFDTVVGVDDTERAKPHPDPAFLALRRMSALSSWAIMIGDTTTDLRMAQAVPMRSIAVTYGVTGNEELQTARPTATASAFDEVVLHVLAMSHQEGGPGHAN